MDGDGDAGAMELLVGAVTDGDHEGGTERDGVDRTGLRAHEVETGTRGSSHRERVHGVCWMRPGALGGHIAQRGPEPGRELRSGGVVRAHEHHALRADRGDVEGKAGADEAEVPTPPVAVGGEADDEAGVLEDAHVVSEEVRSDAEPVGELAGGTVRQSKLVDDQEAMRVRERCVHRDALLQGPDLIVERYLNRH